jgi:bifunctional DNA-binding transcriptional regulator/antitoxin component of YhaV-PrlF toxin-antitoxin module
MDVVRLWEARTVEKFIRSISLKGRVTIPLKIMVRLGIHPRDKVAFILEDGYVRIVATKISLDSLCRSVPALQKSFSDKGMTAIAAEEHAGQVVEER